MKYINIENIKIYIIKFIKIYESTITNNSDDI